METLRLRSSSNTTTVPTVLFGGGQQSATTASSACNNYNSTTIMIMRSPSLAASTLSKVDRYEKLDQNSSFHHSSRVLRSQPELRPSSRMKGPRSVLQSNAITASAASPSTSAMATVKMGIRPRRSSLPPLCRVARPCEVPLWRISPAGNYPRGIQQHGEGWCSMKTTPARQCRAQAASNMGISDLGISDNALDLSKVPLLELLVSERAKVALLLAVAMALCNADRVVMSVAILPLAASHGWTTSFGGIVQSSFLWGYLVSPIPGGMLADRYGGKVVMACGVALWSLATLATPWAARHSMAMLLAVRVLMGLAEGVAMPCMNNIVCKWFPRLERSRAVGLTMAGFHLGSVAALLLSPSLLKNYGVPGPFWVFGSLGFLWLALWCPCISKDPQSSPNISSIEFSYVTRGQDQLQSSSRKQSVANTRESSRMPPLALIFSKLPTWSIILANAMNNWGYFILLTWMPVYFSTVLGVNLRQAAWFSAAPWAMMAWAGFVAGSCSDYLIHLGISITTVRKIMQSVGFVGPAAALLRLNSVTDPTVASLWLTAALGLSAFSQAGFLVNHQEIAPRYAGFLHGVSNTAGTLAAIVSTVGTGYFIERLGSFQAFLTFTSILYVLSTVFWNCNASGERVID